MATPQTSLEQGVLRVEEKSYLDMRKYIRSFQGEIKLIMNDDFPKFEKKNWYKKLILEKFHESSMQNVMMQDFFLIT